VRLTPLQRRTRLMPKRWGIRPRRPRRLDKPQSDPARLEWVREQPCLVPELLLSHGREGASALMFSIARCRGRTEACHEGRKPGMAMKCDDALTLPMCSAHHRQWTDHTGIFKGWTKEQRRSWADERIAETTARYLSHGNKRSA